MAKYKSHDIVDYIDDFEKITGLKFAEWESAIIIAFQKKLTYFFVSILDLKFIIDNDISKECFFDWYFIAIKDNISLKDFIKEQKEYCKCKKSNNVLPTSAKRYFNNIFNYICKNRIYGKNKNIGFKIKSP